MCQQLKVEEKPVAEVGGSCHSGKVSDTWFVVPSECQRETVKANKMQLLLSSCRQVKTRRHASPIHTIDCIQMDMAVLEDMRGTLRAARAQTHV